MAQVVEVQGRVRHRVRRALALLLTEVRHHGELLRLEARLDLADFLLKVTLGRDLMVRDLSAQKLFQAFPG